jgi:3-deoxy-manno-octulosonate cytidylyltransferase (CMP-KDO synthetase)
MTSADHSSGTDRLEEVARKLQFAPRDRVVNVQGDEPLIPPELIDQVAANLEVHPDAAIATLCERIPDAASVFIPNVVKVVFDHRGMAHYFSRAPIPWARDAWQLSDEEKPLPEGVGYYRHIGIYGYRVSFLRDFVTWPPAPAEVTESLEQLRALYNGARIHVEESCQTPPSGVDTQQDLDRLRQTMTAKQKEAPNL